VNIGPKGLVIHSARYGAGDKWVDIRTVLTSRLRARTLAVCVGNHLRGDPYPHVPKSLIVK
jgi:hypothetical protein